jgi:heme o synthase
MSSSPAQGTSVPADMPIETTTLKGRFGAYLELTKPRLSMLSVITALVGFLAARPEGAWWSVWHVLLGTALAAGGAAVLNQWYERHTDARMHRTMDRPLPTGAVSPGAALAFGIFLSLAGTGHLIYWVNTQAALLAAATILIYVLIYTPMKRTSRLSLEVGALAGALPPLIGWAAAEGAISSLGWILFGILFLWQVPHFLAIAWIYREDYAAVNFPMLTVVDASGNKAAAHAFAYCVALLAVSLLPYFLGHNTLFYFLPALLLGLYFTWKTWLFRQASERNDPARSVFIVSITYLPALLLVLVLDRWLFA